MNFSKEELSRYNRHIILPGFGMEAQQKLKAAKVLVVGSGGLGSPVLLYLAAAGAGTIGIVDFDVVEDSNLQRQVLFGINETGTSKVEAAKQRLLSLNPYISIKVYNMQLTSANAMELLQEYDVIADGTDNFAARYLINDACVLLGKPDVYASVYRFEGQVSVFNYTNKEGVKGPNYRDLFPSPPPPGLVPDCAEGGVLGVLPGIIGSMQALEVIKVITGVGEPLSGRLYLFDALSFESRIIKFSHHKENPLTGTNPTITQLINYEQFCGAKAIGMPIKEITPAQLYQWLQQGENIQLIDVREPEEYEEMNMGAQLIPLHLVAANTHAIARDKKVVLHCKTGSRSAQAIRELEATFGYENLYNLKGGIIAYINDIK